ncbi:MAG: hypothetical protein NWE92_05485 [Candidatus Bathyarchaeota archaeon]|nr:hypothetical protein [Candidatus Bathyarchaeota archaeon]
MIEMNRIAVVVGVVLACVIIASASALIASYPPQLADEAITETHPTPTWPWIQATPDQTIYGPKIPAYGGTVELTDLYDAELTYVYVGRTNSTGEGHDHFGFGVETHPSTLYPPYALFSLTYLGNPQDESWDQKFEGYFLNFTSDTGVKEVYLGWFGTNFNASCTTPFSAPFPGSPRGPPQTIAFRANLHVGQVITGQVPNSVSYGSGNSSLGLWSNGTPNAITVTLQRAGWVTVIGEEPTTITNPVHNLVLQEIHLQKDGDGFSFGTPPS